MRLKSWLMVSTILMSLPIVANAQSDPKSCADGLPRQTVVYVDDTDMIKEDSLWALTLSFKLPASMMPGESLTIVQLSPTRGASKQTWNGCWPKGNPSDIEVLKKQIEFSQQINNALLAILVQNSRDFKNAIINSNKAPTKQIIRAIASDGSRFKDSIQPTVRAIIYSDMAENSDLGSAFSASQEEVFKNNLNVYFVHGVFYAFGLGKNIINNQNFAVNALRFWRNALKTMGGIVETMGTEFTIPAIIPEKNFYLDVNLHYVADVLPGKMAIMIDKDGNLIDSWLGISHLAGAGLTGKCICSRDICSITAVTEGGVIGYGVHENVQMVINPQFQGTGFIKVDNSNQFSLDGKKVGM